MKKISAVFLVLTVCWAMSAAAGDIYQWTDSSGGLHFTDNLMKVPPQYREKSKRNVDPLKGIKNRKVVKQEDEKKVAWQMHCGECHSTGASQEGLLGLSKVAIDLNTALPRAVSEVRTALSSAIRNATHFEIDSVQGVNEEAMEHITRYLMEQNR